MEHVRLAVDNSSDGGDWVGDLKVGDVILIEDKKTDCISEYEVLSIVPSGYIKVIDRLYPTNLKWYNPRVLGYYNRLIDINYN